MQCCDAAPLLQLSPDKRIHAMKALASLSRFLGCYDRWMEIRQRYHLTWTTGNESLTALSRFFDDSTNLESMLDWVRLAMTVLPPTMAAIIKFNCLTGLRPSEACESVRLVTNSSVSESGQARKHITYYNQQQECLEHFRFSQFIRRTKCCYISYLSHDNYQWIANLGCKTPPTYAAIRFKLERLGVKCHLAYSRKIFASWLIKSGIDSNTVDMRPGPHLTASFSFYFSFD